MVGTSERITLLPCAELAGGEERTAGPVAILPGEPACLLVDFDGPLARRVEISRDGERWEQVEQSLGAAPDGALVTTATLAPAGPGCWLRCRLHATGPDGVRVTVTLVTGRRGDGATVASGSR